MSPTTSSPTPSKSVTFSAKQTSNRYRDVVEQGVRLRIHQLIQAGVLRAPRPNKQCRGNWKPRMDLVDDPSSPNIIAIFELPGIKNENITLQIKDRRLIVVGNRVDPYAEALASAVASDAPESETQPHSASNTAEILTKPGVHITAVGNDPGGSITPSKNKSVRELRYGLFFRCISVPEGIKQSEVSAGMQDGLLTVIWPRVPAAVRSSGVEVISAPNSGNTPANTIEAMSATHPTVSSDATLML